MNAQAKPAWSTDVIPKNPHRGNLRCPHCEAISVVRSSVEVNIGLREIHYQCPNPYCSFSFKASLIFEYGTSPSAQPNTDINVEMRISERPIPKDEPDDQITIFETIEKTTN